VTVKKIMTNNRGKTSMPKQTTVPSSLLIPPPPPPPPAKHPEHSPCPTPKRAVQGFVLYLLATAFFVFYLVWLTVPQETLASTFGISFLPQRYWAVAVPIYLSVTFVTFVFIVYPSLGLLATPPLNTGDLRYIADSHTVYNEDSFTSANSHSDNLHRAKDTATAATKAEKVIPKVCDIHPECIF